MNCYLLKQPRIALIYIAVSGQQKTPEFVRHFTETLEKYPPGFDYDLIAVCNGGQLDTFSEIMLKSIGAILFNGTNIGWDITGYIEAVHGPAKDYDIVVCLGESCYFHRQNWGVRLLDCWQNYGPGMYGFFSSNAVRAHMNTTAFATTPELIESYNSPVYDRATRYEFEHGERSFWRRLFARNIPTRLITWDGCWKPLDWRVPENILSRGDQSNTLFRCNHWDRFDKAESHVRSTWSANADIPFK